jgi:hypothetical protein
LFFPLLEAAGFDWAAGAALVLALVLVFGVPEAEGLAATGGAREDGAGCSALAGAVLSTLSKSCILMR